MRTLSLLLASFLFLAACGSDSTSTSGPAGDGGSAEGEGAAPVSDSAEVMAAALHQLVTVDHTYGQGPPPFTDYKVQSSLDPTAGEGDESANRVLTDDERLAIEERLSPLGTVEVIDDPETYWGDELAETPLSLVIVGVGEPAISGDGAFVPVSLWCGSLCGTWLTYELERTDAGWTVIGIDGDVAIS